MDPSYHGRSNPLRDKAAAAIAAGVLILAIVATSLHFATTLLPRVGKIVVFDSAEARGIPTGAALTVRIAGRSPAATCVLDVHLMQIEGGSLIVEAVLPGRIRTYRVHWAGRRTSRNPTNCGPSANLLISPYDMGTLLFATHRPP